MILAKSRKKDCSICDAIEYVVWGEKVVVCGLPARKETTQYYRVANFEVFILGQEFVVNPFAGCGKEGNKLSIWNQIKIFGTQMTDEIPFIILIETNFT